MNYIVMHGPHRPISGQNPERSEGRTAKEALQLVEDIKASQKVVLILNTDGKQITLDELARIASCEEA